jgi:hypothetical protein
MAEIAQQAEYLIVGPDRLKMGRQVLAFQELLHPGDGFGRFAKFHSVREDFDYERRIDRP